MNRIIYKDMPYRVRALTCEDADGYQTTIINSRLSCEQNYRSMEHEKKHVNDFGSEVDVSCIEALRHE